MPPTRTARPDRRTGAIPYALASLEERMMTLGTETCGAGLGPVLGEGDPYARLALVGEAPGEREVVEGYPFAGPAGRLLDELLERTGLSRGDFWLTNVVKCRPVREQGGRLNNRAPLAGETKAWLPLLLEELAIVNPRLVVCLGATSARALLGKGFKLTEQRGEWVEGPAGSEAMATFHPAYILHLSTHDPAGGEHARETLLADLRGVKGRLQALTAAGAAEGER